MGLHRTLSNLKPIYRSVPHVPREAVKVLGCIAEGSFGEVSLAKTQQWGELAVKWLKVCSFSLCLSALLLSCRFEAAGCVAEQLRGGPSGQDAAVGRAGHEVAQGAIEPGVSKVLPYGRGLHLVCC